MLPKRRRDFEPMPTLTPAPEDEYERVSVGEIQLVDASPTVIIAADPPSLSPMAVELEETVLALTRLPAPPPASSRPSVAWIATIFSVSTMLSLGATSVVQAGAGGGARGPVAAAAGIVAPPPVMTTFPAVEAPVPATATEIAIPVNELPAAVLAPAPVPHRRRAQAAIAAESAAGHEHVVAVTVPRAEPAEPAERVEPGAPADVAEPAEPASE